jgi:thioredoxin-related protein
MHDKNNNLLQPGDTVLLCAVVKSVTPNPDFCNVTVESEMPIDPKTGRKDTFTTNSRLFEKVLLALFAFALGALPLPAAEIAWRFGYNDAVKEAASAGKPLLMDFLTDGCPPCAKLEATTFADPAIVALVNERFVPLRVYVPAKAVPQHKGASVAKAMNVAQFPTLFTVAPGRSILDRHDGYLDAAKLKPLLERALTFAKPRNLDAEPQTALTADLPTGLDPSKLADKPQLWYGDVASPADAIQAAELPDLAGKPYLTVVARDAAERQRILNEIMAGPLGAKVRAQAQAPDHWHLEPFKLRDNPRFAASGLALLLQRPPDKPGGFGKLLGDEYAWTEATKVALERKADPNFNWSGGKSEGVPPLLLIAGAGLVLLALWPTKSPAETLDDV